MKDEDEHELLFCGTVDDAVWEQASGKWKYRFEDSQPIAAGSACYYATYSAYQILDTGTLPDGAVPDEEAMPEDFLEVTRVGDGGDSARSAARRAIITILGKLTMEDLS